MNPQDYPAAPETLNPFEDSTVTQVFTTAPHEYDYPRMVKGSISMGMFDNRGREYRAVYIYNEDVDYQCGRYGSGLHPAYNTQEFCHAVRQGRVSSRYRP